MKFFGYLILDLWTDNPKLIIRCDFHCSYVIYFFLLLETMDRYNQRNQSTTGNVIKNVLKDDLAARQPGNKTGKLFPLSSININNDYDYSYPTIVTDMTATMKNNMIRDITVFKEVFNNKYQKYISKLKFNNILIAGGSIGSTLLQKEINNDIDIFVYGLSLDQADAKVKDIIQQLYASYIEYIKVTNAERKESNTNDNNFNNLPRTAKVINVRNKHCISINFNDGGKIQIILRLYKNVEQILYGFDLGSSAVGYNGSEIYFTTLGKLSYEYMINVIDPSRRSTTYESRLIKYYNRGFSIVLPDLDIKKLRTNYFKYNMAEVAELPYFTFAYREIKGNKLYHPNFIGKKERKCKGENTTPSEVPVEFDTEKYSDYQSNMINEYQIFYLNLGNLVRDQHDYYYYSENMNLDIINNMPYITGSRIIDFYDKLAESIYSKCTFNVKLFSTYFSKDLLPEVINQLYYEKNYEYLTGLIEEQKEIILKRLENIEKENHNELPWITLDPGSQLTGSFNPIISDPADWYGYYFIGNPLKEECGPKSLPQRKKILNNK
jgi:hypothetical protein